MELNNCEFTKKKFIEFRILYNRAIELKKTKFIFEEREVLVAYAKYIIEYLEPKFKIKKYENS